MQSKPSLSSGKRKPYIHKEHSASCDLSLWGKHKHEWGCARTLHVLCSSMLACAHRVQNNLGTSGHQPVSPTSLLPLALRCFWTAFLQSGSFMILCTSLLNWRSSDILSSPICYLLKAVFTEAAVKAVLEKNIVPCLGPWLTRPSHTGTQHLVSWTGFRGWNTLGHSTGCLLLVCL